MVDQQSTVERKERADFEMIVCGILPQITIVTEHAFALYTVCLAKHGETIIGYHCAMIATLLSGPHSVPVPLTESTHTHQ
jgi:hypothetical protein